MQPQKVDSYYPLSFYSRLRGLINTSCFSSTNGDTYLDDLAHAAARFFENGFHALAGCLGLVGDAAFD